MEFHVRATDDAQVDMASEVWGSTAADRIKALAPASVSGAVAMDNIATRTLTNPPQ